MEEEWCGELSPESGSGVFWGSVAFLAQTIHGFGKLFLDHDGKRRREQRAISDLVRGSSAMFTQNPRLTKDFFSQEGTCHPEVRAIGEMPL